MQDKLLNKINDILKHYNLKKFSSIMIVPSEDDENVYIFNIVLDETLNNNTAMKLSDDIQRLFSSYSNLIPDLRYFCC